MRTASSLASFAFLLGWAGFLLACPDGRAMVMLLAAFLLARRRTAELQLFSGLLLFTVLATGPPGVAAVLALLSCLAAYAAKPTRPYTVFERAILWSLIPLVIIFVVTVATKKTDSLLHLPVIIAAGWCMIVRLSAARGAAFLRRATLPVFVALFVFGWGWARGKPILRTEYQAARLLMLAHSETNQGEALSLVDRATRLNPWRAAIWAYKGRLQLQEDDVQDAFESFQKGYAVRPGRTNPCLEPLVETALLLEEWGTIAKLITNGAIPPAIHSTRRVDALAVELWRIGHLDLAAAVLDSRDSLSFHEQELAGWMAYDAGEHRTASAFLCSLAMTGRASGETMYRAALAAAALGEERKAQAILSEGARRYPLHRGLAASQGKKVIPACRFALGPQDDGIELGNSVLLLGWDLYPEAIHPGDSIMVCIAWVASKPLRDMAVILHADYGSPVRWRANADHAPLRGNLPTSMWPVGEVVIDTAGFVLPPHALPGEYRLYTGLWVPGDQESRLMPDQKFAYLVPRGERRIPIGSFYVGSNE